MKEFVNANSRTDNIRKTDKIPYVWMCNQPGKLFYLLENSRNLVT